MMNFFTKLLTPVFIALGMVNPAPVIETPTPDIQVQQELIELRKKVQELEGQVETDVNKGSETKALDAPKEVVAKKITSTPLENKQSSGTETLANVKDKVPAKFEFTNIEIETEKTEATIKWQTTLPSESRVVLHRNNLVQNILPSSNGLGNNHSIKISGLDPSNSYTYELIAKNQNKEISRFDSFYTKREYIVKLKDKDKKCFTFVAEDTGGVPLVGGSFRVSGSKFGSDNNFKYWIKNLISNNDGEFFYCENATHIEIDDVGNDKLYSFFTSLE